ncbi:hypothetical protein BH23PAT2_BH23PAT2_06390 [soil metagenome]
MDEGNQEIFAVVPEVLETQFDRYVALQNTQLRMEEVSHATAARLLQCDLLYISEAKRLKELCQKARELVNDIVFVIFESGDDDHGTKLLLAHDVTYHDLLFRRTVMNEILGEPLFEDDEIPETKAELTIEKKESLKYFSAPHSVGTRTDELDDDEIAGSICGEHSREARLYMNIFIAKLLFPDLYEFEDEQK